MATGSDLRDILDLDLPEEKEETITRETLFGENKKKKAKKTEANIKRPEGMHRELWGLLWTDNKDAPPIFPTDSNLGYKQMKAKIGRSKVRPWRWTPFTNPARKDGAVFHHWRRVADEGLEYPFVRFNKVIDVPTYSDLEYQQHLLCSNWTKQETDHLLELCRRFDLRFVIIQDRWDSIKFPKQRSMEDLKERYYNICKILTKLRNPSLDQKIRCFDANHERRRKEQLEKLFHRTEEEIEEEERLVQELKKIEQRKKEREKKALDLQKLITAADNNSDSRRTERKMSKKVLPHKARDNSFSLETTSIKFPDLKQSGVYLRSQKMKLPISLGQKKTKAIEQMLEEFGIDANPTPTQEIVTDFNELRQDMVLLYELKLALTNCEYELQTLRHRYETLAPGKIADFDNSKPEFTVGNESMDVSQ